MARGLGLNPAKLGKIDNHKRSPGNCRYPASSNNSISKVSARGLPATSPPSKSDVGSKGRKEKRDVPPGSSLKGDSTCCTVSDGGDSGALCSEVLTVRRCGPAQASIHGKVGSDPSDRF